MTARPSWEEKQPQPESVPKSKAVGLLKSSPQAKYYLHFSAVQDDDFDADDMVRPPHRTEVPMQKPNSTPAAACFIYNSETARSCLVSSLYLETIVIILPDDVIGVTSCKAVVFNSVVKCVA